MKTSPAKKMQSKHSHESQTRPGTYTVHSTSIQASMNDLPKKAKSRAKGPLISKGDPNKVRLPCIDNHLAPDGSRMNVASAPIEMRVAIQLNKVKLFKDKTPNPPGALPPLHIPLWDEWPLDAKIPDFRYKSWPPGSLYFTRGKLCKSLSFQRNDFNLTDPKGFQNACKLGDYTALHDPHTIRYFKNKSVVPLLRKNKLINSKNEVICSTKDYNKFRAYLSTIQSEGVNQKLQKESESMTLQMKIRRSFQTHKKVEQEGDKVAERHLNARMIQDDIVEEKVSKAKIQQEDWKSQIKAFELWKRDQRFIKTQEILTDEYVSIYRRKKLYVDRNEDRKRSLGMQCYEMKRAEYNHKYDKMVNTALRERESIDKVITLQKRDEQSLELKDVIDETVRRRKEKWCKRYEKHIQYSQQNEEKIQAARREKVGRELQLQRKYFDLWRAFIQRKHAVDKTDSVHRSSWKIEKDLKTVVNSLEEESGYDPKQNLFLQLFQNRKNLEEWAEKQEQKAVEDMEKKAAEEAEAEAKILADLVAEQEAKKVSENQKPKRKKKKKKKSKLDEGNLADDEDDNLDGQE